MKLRLELSQEEVIDALARALSEKFDMEITHSLLRIHCKVTGVPCTPSEVTADYEEVR